jgi:nicotinate dehydrogenase subunit A
MTAFGRDAAAGDPEGDRSLSLDLTVNGVSSTITCPEDATLLEVLRERLGLTSVRYGCGEEQCGACVVLVEGKPAFSCTLAAASAAGRSIETAESLSLADPLPAAILAHQAGQCGYCLTGILMTATALLRADPAPTRTTVLEALSPHLCRCGAHQRIVDAILSVRNP